MTAKLINKTDEEFYADAVQYWSEIPATVDGMLGGFGSISQTDIRCSKVFLKQILTCKSPPNKNYALDCGAGIGRITKFLLSDFFDRIDLVEQNPAFLEQSKQYLGEKLVEKKIGNFFSIGLQNFKPENEKYDIIWIQWVLGHLTDADLVNFLKTCQTGLKPNGMIVVKENITSTEEVEVDEEDSSVTRPISLLQKIFSKADLICFRQMKQNNFPKELYTVYMFALKPAVVSNNEIKLSVNDDANQLKNL